MKDTFDEAIAKNTTATRIAAAVITRPVRATPT
jgi:hypothetical protein